MKRRGTRAFGGVIAGGVLVALVMSGGCQRPLLSPADSRTPFDAYDAVRGQQVPQTAMNEFGREELNLRQRLAPKQ